MSREIFEKLTEDGAWPLLEQLSQTPGALDELFETGSYTLEKNGKTYTVWLDAQEEK